MYEHTCILAIDLGTSGPKVGLVTPGGQVPYADFEPVPTLTLPGGGVEQRPGDWWDAICTAVRRMLSRSGFPTENILAISCTTQWSGTVPVDRSGEPLMNALIWMDSRGAPDIQRVVSGRITLEGYDPARLFTWLRLAGGVPARSGKDSIAHILYIQRQHPGLYARTYKFLEPKDYLNLRLTGRFAATYDSITLHWLTDNRDIHHVRYDDRLLRFTGVDREKLPELLCSVDILGELLPHTAAELGLRPGLPVVGGSPDIQSAAVGSGAVEPFAAHLYIGTSSWLACHVPYKKTDIFHHMASLPSAIPGRYLMTNEQESAGVCLNKLIDNILFSGDDRACPERPGDAYSLLNEMAATVRPGAEGLIFTPWLNGERTPVDNQLVRGGFVNQGLHTNRAHMVRAVFEGVAYNTRWMLQYVERFVGRKLDQVNFIGGGALSDLWCQIHADVLDRPVAQVTDPIHANLRGAGFLAAAALGETSFDSIPGLVELRKVYQPNLNNRSLYDALFSEFKNLYRRLIPIYTRLNRSHSQ